MHSYLGDAENTSFSHFLFASIFHDYLFLPNIYDNIFDSTDKLLSEPKPRKTDSLLKLSYIKYKSKDKCGMSNKKRRD